MRRTGALAAFALFVLALGSASCKPSSLTPFGIGTQEPDADSGVNGSWAGVTSAGLTITFQVASGTVVNLAILTTGGACSQGFDVLSDTTPVTDDAFIFTIPLDPQGELIIRGQFTSPTTCTGSYSFAGVAVAGSCPTSASATFVATKSS